MTAIVLAAGKGKRISTIADTTPKPLLQICGKPVLVHNLILLAKHGVQSVWINLHTGAQLIRHVIGNGNKWGLNVQYVYERRLLGTAGGAKNISRKLKDDTVLVVYGDNYTDCNLRRLINRHRADHCTATLAVFDGKKKLHSGIAGGRLSLNKLGRVTKFVEGNPNGLNWINAGICVIQKMFLDTVPNGYADFGKDVFPAAIALGEKISAYKMSGFCYGMDTPESYRLAQERAVQI